MIVAKAGVMAYGWKQWRNDESVMHRSNINEMKKAGNVIYNVEEPINIQWLSINVNNGVLFGNLFNDEMISMSIPYVAFSNGSSKYQWNIGQPVAK